MPSLFKKTVGMKRRHWEFVMSHPEINYSALFQEIIDRLIEEESR